MEYIVEKERKTPVKQKADIVVAGGGVAGISAAIAASRMGANVLLIERYGQLGGMATGGLVTKHLGFGRLKFGLNKEIGERILSQGSGIILRKEGPWKWIEDMGFDSKESILYDGEDMKYLLERILIENNVRFQYHSYIVGAVVEDSLIKGVIIEDKTGRNVATGKIIIDATGDGDVFASAGEEYEVEEHPWGLGLGHRYGGVDIEKALKFRSENLQEYAEIIEELKQIIGVRYYWNPSARPGITLCMGPRVYGYDVLDPKDSTRLEIDGKLIAANALEFLREKLPGFENAFMVEYAPQFGIRVTRRLKGKYILSSKEVRTGARFDDAVIKSIYDVPYQCLLPKKLDNLMVAGRCISMDPGVDELRLIGPCIATGEVTGVAAALSIKKGISPKSLSVNDLQAALKGKTLP